MLQKGYKAIKQFFKIKGRVSLSIDYLTICLLNPIIMMDIDCFQGGKNEIFL